MATGITKNKWIEETEIITHESFNSNYDYNLTYEGKTSCSELLRSLPEEKYRQVFKNESANQLYYGDNLDVLKHLLHNTNLKGQIKLIYIDPPYGTNNIFVSRKQKSSYKDNLIGSHFIEFIRRRIVLLHELLSMNGSIYIHLDNNMIFETKLILDEVFGKKNFRGFITRKKCGNKNYTKNTYGNISDYIIFYSKSENFHWERAMVPWSNEKIKKEYTCIDADTRRKYKKVPIHAPGIRNGETGKAWRGKLPPKGKHWQYTPSKLDEFDKKGEIYWSANGNPRRKVYLDNSKGLAVQDIWTDVQDSVNQSIKITGYPTEKNPYLIERIINASSATGDYVLDCFAGSGTTLDVARQLNRKWIGVDNSSEAINSIFRRFYSGLEEMGDFVDKTKNTSEKEFSQLTLFESSLTYKTDNAKSKDFVFFCDSNFIDNAINIYKSYNSTNE